jgi:multiple sugar transport system permease protein
MAHVAEPRQLPGPNRRSPLRATLTYAALLALTALFLAPVVWMVVSSLKTNAQATGGTGWIPHPLDTASYHQVLSSSEASPVPRWFLNSLLAATIQTILILVTASLAAYALARMEFPFKRLIFGVIVATLFIPPIILIIPNYVVVQQIGWIDSLWAIAVPGAASAFGVFFLRQFFAGLPPELEKAALIDGANRLQIFLRVIIPNARPALATLALLSFLTNWNDFVWPVYVLLSPRNLTLPAGLALLQTSNAINVALIMAGAVVASVPVLLLYAAAQRYIIESVSRSGVKG